MKDRVSMIFVQYGQIDVQDGAFVVIDQKGVRMHIPVGSIACIMLEPGTRISHAAVHLASTAGTLLVWVGESGVRLYASGQPGGARADLAGGARKQRVLLRISARGFTQAHVIAPAFDKRHLGRPPVHFANGVGHSRRVEGYDLPLQRERGGGDGHAAVGFDGPFHRGGKVSDRLSGSRARLHEQMSAVVQSLGDRGRHFLLPFAPSSAHGPSFQPG